MDVIEEYLDSLREIYTVAVGPNTPEASCVMTLTPLGIRLVEAQLQQLLKRFCYISSGQRHTEPYHKHAASCLVRIAPVTTSIRD